VSAALDSIGLPQAARVSVDREVPQLAGSELSATIDPEQRPTVRAAIDSSFVAAFALVMMIAAAVAVAAAASGFAIRQARSSEDA
jgi:hypothetical protein